MKITRKNKMGILRKWRDKMMMMPLISMIVLLIYNTIVDVRTLGEFQRVQKASARVNLLVASMPTKREDRAGFFETISATDGQPTFTILLPKIHHSAEQSPRHPRRNECFAVTLR